MRVLLVSANREMLPSPVVPLGVLMVAGALEDAHDVRVLDLCFEPSPLDALAQAIFDHHPDVVGVGIRNLHDNSYGDPEPLLSQYDTLFRTIRHATDVPLVVGGAAVSLQPQTMFGRFSPDHLLVGEGEFLFRELVDGLAHKRTFPPLLVSETVGKRLVSLKRSVPPTETPYPLDALPRAARHWVDPRYYAFDGTTNIQTKRGCAFQCTYCDYPDLEGRRIRLRSPDQVAEEVLACKATPNISHVFFVDSVFNVPRSHALGICDALIARGSPLPWVCYASPASLDGVLVERMARAGCVGAEIGTDTGSEEMLKRLKKPFTLDDVRRVRQLFRTHGILDCHTFVLGAEGETATEALGTLDFVSELDPDVAAFLVFTEDREERSPGGAHNRAEILEVLRGRALLHPGWVVPELGIRFGEKLTRFAARKGLRGPAWLHLARERRRRLMS